MALGILGDFVGDGHRDEAGQHPAGLAGCYAHQAPVIERGGGPAGGGLLGLGLGRVRVSAGERESDRPAAAAAWAWAAAGSCPWARPSSAASSRLERQEERAATRCAAGQWWPARRTSRRCGSAGSWARLAKAGCAHSGRYSWWHCPATPFWPRGRRAPAGWPYPRRPAIGGLRSNPASRLGCAPESDSAGAPGSPAARRVSRWPRQPIAGRYRRGS